MKAVTEAVAAGLPFSPVMFKMPSLNTTNTTNVNSTQNTASQLMHIHIFTLMDDEKSSNFSWTSFSHEQHVNLSAVEALVQSMSTRDTTDNTFLYVQHFRWWWFPSNFCKVSMLLKTRVFALPCCENHVISHSNTLPACNSEWVSEQFLNGTSAQLGYTVPFTSVYAGNYVTEDKSKTNIPQKLNTTQKSKHPPEQN